MSINRSEQFLYLQNKAKHYENIKKMKPSVKDQLQKHYRNTIDHSPSRRNRANPYNIQYEMKVSNDNLINRLMKIATSERTQVNAQGYYSRYNNNSRSFRKKDPHRDQVQRNITIQNQKIVDKLSKTKPRVGLKQSWQKEHQQKVKHKKNLSVYADSQKSKNSLLINKNSFIPQTIRRYFLNESLNETVDGRDVIELSKQDLLKLPKILKQPSHGRSRSELNTLSMNQRSLQNLHQLQQ